MLNGVSIANEDQSAVCVTDADKVFFTTAEGTENTLQTTGTFAVGGDTNPDAVIISQNSLTLNGMGSLTVESAERNGISGKDEVTITGGTYAIHSALDAIEAHDSVAICGGNFSIETGKDGIHSEDSDAIDANGSIYINGGTIQITTSGNSFDYDKTAELDRGTLIINEEEVAEIPALTMGGMGQMGADGGRNLGRQTALGQV